MGFPHCTVYFKVGPDVGLGRDPSPTSGLMATHLYDSSNQVRGTGKCSVGKGCNCTQSDVSNTVYRQDLFKAQAQWCIRVFLDISKLNLNILRSHLKMLTLAEVEQLLLRDLGVFR